MDITLSKEVVRYLDYRAQADQRRKELELLREKCLTITGASRLSDAEAPKEIFNFLRQQRDLVEEERRHRKEATEILRRFRADENGIPSVVSCQKQLEVEKHRQKEAIAFLHSYRASKESILRRTQGFWKTNTPSNQGIAVPSIPLFDAVEACARQWDDTCDQELLDDLISEAEFLSSSPDKNELLEDLPHQNDASKRTILWLSLMVLFSRNIVGLVLSLSLLNYTLRSDAKDFKGLITQIGNDMFFSFWRAFAYFIQVPSGEKKSLSPGDYLVQSTETLYQGVTECIRQALNASFNYWWNDSAPSLDNFVNGTMSQDEYDYPASILTSHEADVSVSGETCTTSSTRGSEDELLNTAQVPSSPVVGEKGTADVSDSFNHDDNAITRTVSEAEEAQENKAAAEPGKRDTSFLAMGAVVAVGMSAAALLGTKGRRF